MRTGEVYIGGVKVGDVAEFTFGDAEDRVFLMPPDAEVTVEVTMSPEDSAKLWEEFEHATDRAMLAMIAKRLACVTCGDDGPCAEHE